MRSGGTPSGQVGMDVVKRIAHANAADGPISSEYQRKSARRRSGGDEVAVRVDSPPFAHCGQLLVERPAVRALLPHVVWAGSLQGHAAAVVADGPDLGNLLVAEP